MSNDNIIEFGSDFNYSEFSGENSKVSIPTGALLFGCGRYAINHLISYHLKFGLWKNIYIPEYFCYEVVQSIKNTGINVTFYADYPLADDNDIISKLDFIKGDVLFRMNYFGMRNFRDNSLIGIPVIEDHSHNLFSNWASNSNADWCVASLRKTLPIPDGGIVWSPQDNQSLSPVLLTHKHKLSTQIRFDAMYMKYKYINRIGNIKKEEFLNKYKETEISFEQNEISAISNISKSIINKIPNNIDSYKRKNYDYLISLLDLKKVEIVNLNKIENPFSLILLFETENKRDLIRKFLVVNDVYPAVLWSVDNPKAKAEIVSFSKRMLSIHIDFRYSNIDILRMSKIINDALIN